MTIRTELLNLQTQSGGLLHAEKVVSWAKNNPKSDLHGSFEWNNDKAADEYRIWQARRLIAIHVVSEEGIRQLVSLTIDREQEGGYRHIDAVLQNQSLRGVLLADALADLERVRLKYEGLVELARVWDEVRNISKQEKRGLSKRGNVRRRKAA